mmetsp:Transcript_14687/g.33753  ORF Transcript_14687/g.33753 Transcript_14687/m.33753 type:complete len:253 (-) Transcript_14687:565-1323(-)
MQLQQTTSVFQEHAWPSPKGNCHGMPWHRIIESSQPAAPPFVPGRPFPIRAGPPCPRGATPHRCRNPRGRTRFFSPSRDPKRASPPSTNTTPPPGPERGRPSTGAPENSVPGRPKRSGRRRGGPWGQDWPIPSRPGRRRPPPVSLPSPCPACPRGRGRGPGPTLLRVPPRDPPLPGGPAGFFYRTGRARSGRRGGKRSSPSARGGTGFPTTTRGPGPPRSSIPARLCCCRRRRCSPRWSPDLRLPEKWWIRR